jgi:hypothetical protein
MPTTAPVKVTGPGSDRRRPASHARRATPHATRHQTPAQKVGLAGDHGGGVTGGYRKRLDEAADQEQREYVSPATVRSDCRHTGFDRRIASLFGNLFGATFGGGSRARLRIEAAEMAGRAGAEKGAERMIWRGWGLLVFFIFLAWYCLALATGHDPDRDSGSMSLVCAISAASVFWVSRYRKSHPRTIVDSKTGNAALVPHSDDLWFVPMKYWAYILLAGAVFYAARFATAL